MGAIRKNVRSEIAVEGMNVAEELEVGGGEGGVDGLPSAEAVYQNRKGGAEGSGGEQADGYVHVSDRGHAGDGGEEDDEGGDEVSAVDGGDGVGEDEVEDISAADELVAGDGGVGEEDGDDAEDAGGLVVACFEQVGDGELGEASGARGDEVDEGEAAPSSCALPEGREAVLVGVFGAAEQRAGSDPGAEESEDQDEGGERASGDEVVGLGLDLAEARERDGEEGCDDEDEDDGVEVHLGVGCLRDREVAALRLTTLYAETTKAGEDVLDPSFTEKA